MPAILSAKPRSTLSSLYRSMASHRFCVHRMQIWSCVWYDIAADNNYWLHVGYKSRRCSTQRRLTCTVCITGFTRFDKQVLSGFGALLPIIILKVKGEIQFV